MRKMLLSAGYACLILLCAKCQPEDQNANATTGKVSFSHSLQSRTGGRSKETPSPSFVLLSVKDSEDKEQRIKLPLFDLGKGYVSENVELKTGKYNLTQFVVLDANNKIIYATPLEGSELAKYVTAPLPSEFTVTNEVIQVNSQVLAVMEDDQPELYGLANFSFNLVEPKLKEMHDYTTFDNPIPFEKYFFFYDELGQLSSYDHHFRTNPTFYFHFDITYGSEGPNSLYTITTQGVDNGVPGPIAGKTKVYLDANSNIIREAMYSPVNELISDNTYSRFPGGYEILVKRKYSQFQGKFGETRVRYEMDTEGNIKKQTVYTTHFENIAVEDRIEKEYTFTHTSRINPLHKLPPSFRSITSLGTFTGGESRNLTLKVIPIGCQDCGELSFSYSYNDGYVTEVLGSVYPLYKRTFTYY
jgi:hypothetical protein